MEKAYKSFLLLFLLFTVKTYASGDVCILDLRETNVTGAAEFDDLVVCQQGDTLSVLVAGESAVAGATLEIQLPNGLVYSSGAVLGDGTSLNMLSNDPPIFSLPAFGGSDSLVVNVPIEGTCPIVDVWEEPSPIYINYVLDYGSGDLSFTPALAYNNGIFIPVINIQSISPDYPILNVGDSYTRTIEVSQDGLKAFLNSFTYQSQNPSEVQVSNLEIGLLGGTPVPLSFTTNGADVTANIDASILQAIGANGIWDETQTLYIYETVTAEACLTENFTSDFLFSWGCGGDLCRTTSTTNGFNVGGGLPIVDFVVDEFTGDNLCGTNVLEIAVTNVGNENIPNSAYAKDFLLNIVQSCLPEDFVEYFEFTAVAVNDASAALPVFDGLSHNISLADLGILEDLDNDGVADDLALGASFDVRIEFARKCESYSCGEEPALCPGGWVVEGVFTDQCADVNGKEIYTVPGPSVETLISSSIASVPEISGETATMPFSYCYEYSVNTVDCAGATVGLKFTTSNDGISIANALVNGQAIAVTDLGENEYLIPGGTISNVNGPIEDCWELELSYTGPCGNDGPGLYNVEVIYDCPCAGCSQTRVCDDYYFVIYNACVGGGVCDGIGVIDYEVERNSFGWSDETATQFVDGNSTGVLTDRAYTCDGVNITVSGDVVGSNINSVDYAVTFSADEMVVPFEFLGGALLINGTTACSALEAPVVSTLTDGRVQWLFDLNTCFTGVLSDSDVLELSIDLIVQDIAGIPPYFELVQVQGTFFTNGNDEECDLGIKDFYVMNPAVTTTLEVVSDPDGCASNVVLHGLINAVGPLGDDFPNEYRPWVGNFGNFAIQVPAGYSYVASSAYILPLQGSMAGDTISVNAITNSSEIVFPNIDNVIDVPDKTDNGPIIAFGIELLPTCSAESIGESYFDYSFEENYYSIAGPSPCNIIQEGEVLGILNYTEPIFNLTALNPIREGINEVVEWDVEICDVNNVSVNHSWMTFNNLGNEVSLESITDITDPNNPIALSTNEYNAENSWASIGGFAGSGCRIYRFAATFNECNPSDAEIIFNWNCEDNVAGPFGANNSCNDGNLSVPVSLLPQEAAIQANLLNHSDTVGLCETGFFEIEFKNVKKGTVYDIVFDIIIPLQGVEFVPNSFEIAYPIDNAYQAIGFDPTLVGATPLGFQYRYEMNDVDAGFLAGLESIPSPTDTENRFKIRFDFETECGFISGDIFRFITYGFSPCGEQTVGTFQNEDVHAEDGVASYSLQTSILTEDIKPCEEPSTFTIQVQNLGPEATVLGDIVRIVLPENVFYLSNTSSAITPNSWTIGEPVIETVFGFEELTWTLPSSLGVNELAEFTFQLNADDDIACFNQPFAVNSFTGTQLTCATTGELCDVLIQTGGQDVSLEVIKPDLQFFETTTSLTASPTCNGENTELLTASIGMINEGEAIDEGTFTYFTFAQDGNGNGQYDEGEDEIIYTHTYTSAIPSNGTVNFFIDFEVPAGMTCPVIVFLDGASNCVCEESSFYFPEVAYENAGPDVTVCSGIETELGCEGLENYIYSWTPEDGTLSCYDCPNPSVIYENEGNVSSTATYWLTTDRGNGCTSSDMVVVTFQPQTVTNAFTVSECEGTVISLEGPTNGINYLWSPTDGIDNPTISNPNLIVQEGGTTYTLEYTGEDGCTALYIKNVIGQPSVTTTINVTGETSFCEGESSNVVLDAGSGFVSYEWSMEEDLSFTADTQTIMPTQAGTYSVIVSDGSTGPCTGVPSPPIAILEVMVSNPVINIDGDTELCVGESSTLTISGSNTNVEWYGADANGNPVGAILFSGSSYEVNSTGNYMAVVTDENGCTAQSNNVQIMILSSPPILINDGNGMSSICEGEEASLSASFGFSNHIWSLDGEFYASGQSTIVVSESGSYSVEAISQNGCTANSGIYEVSIFSNPNPVISADGPLTFCEGEAVNLSVDGSFASYQWLLNGNPINNANGAILNVNSSGVYSVEVNDANNCQSVSVSVEVFENPLPEVSIVSTSILGCEDEMITINASGSFVSYEWYYNGAVFASDNSVLEVINSGNYYVIVTDQNGCTATSNTLDIEYVIIEEANLVTSSASLCPGESITLFVDDGFEQYNWYISEELVQSGSEESYELNEAATVVVEYIDENGCVGTTNIVTITETDLAMPVLNMSGNEFICEGESILFEIEGMYVGYQWYLNDAPIENASEANYLATTAGTYYAIVTNEQACESTSPVIELTVGTLPNPTISSLSTTYCEGDSFTIELENGPFDALQWYLNGSLLLNETGNSITTDIVGTYFLEVLNGDNCSNVSNEVVISSISAGTASLTNSSGAICEGESSQLIITSGFVQYDWFVNGVLVQSGESNEYTLTESGIVYVEYRDENGCIDLSNEINVIQNGAPTPSLNVSGIIELCEGEDYELMVMESFQTYQWYLNGTAIDNANSNTYVPNQGGDYYAIVSNGDNCEGQTAEVGIVYELIVVPEISSSTSSICEGSELSINIDNGPYGFIQWFVDGNAILNSNEISLNISDPGSYYVMVGEGGKCSAVSAPIEITVLDPGSALLSAAQSSICEESTVTMSVTEGFEQYDWYVNDELVESGTDNTFELETSGAVMVVYYDANGCQGNSNVLSISESGTPVPTTNVVGVENVCTGEVMELTVDEFYESYQWYLDDIAINGGTLPDLEAIEEGTYYVEVVDGECVYISEEILIQIDPMVDPMISVDQEAICDGGQFSFTVDNGPFDEIQWYLNGEVIVNETGLIYTSDEAGVYNIIASNAETCVGTSNEITVINYSPQVGELFANQTNICSNNALQLSVTPGFQQYDWFVDGLQMQTGLDNDFDLMNPGLVVVNYIDANGCEGTTNELVISGNEAPNPFLNLIGDHFICGGDFVELFTIESYSTYQWYFNGNAITGAIESTFMTNQPGSYYVVVSDENGCLGQSPEVSIMVTGSSPETTVDNTFVCEGDYFTFNLENAFSYLSIQWYRDGLPVYNETNASLTSNVTGTYFVEVSDGGECNSISEPVVINTLNPEPATITALTSNICEGGAISLSVTSGYSNYNWFVNGILMQEESGVNFTTEDAGIVFVTYVDNNGCLGTSNEVSILETPAPVPALNVTGTQNICNGETFDIAVVELYQSYQWYLNGVLIEGATDPIYSTGTAGEYYAIVSNGNDCTGQTPNIEIVVGNETSPQIETNQTLVCNGSVFTIELVNGPFDNIQWYLDGNPIFNEIGNSLTSNEAGLYFVETSSGDECFGTSNEIVINNINVGAMNIVSNETAVCQGSLVLVTAPEGMDEYTWYVNGVMVQSGSNNELTMTEGGLVYVAFVGNNGCSGTSNQLVISETPAPLPGINLNGMQMICEGEELVLSVLEAYQSYQWYFNYASLPGETEPNLNATESGTYYAIVNNGGECDGQTLTVDLVVKETPNPIIEVNDTILCEGGEFVFTIVNGPFEEIQWYKDGIAIWGEINDTMIMVQSGTYHVEVYNGNDCLGTSNEITVTVLPIAPIYIQTNTNANFCEGGNVNITASEGFANYSWVIDGVIVQDGLNNQFIASESAMIYVIGTGENGCESSSGTVEVVTNPLPQPEIIISSGDNSLCEEETVLLSVSGAYQLINWFLNGELIPGGVANVILAEEPGEYTVFVDDLAGCSGTSEPFTLISTGTPEISITSSSETNEICEGESVTLTVEAGYEVYDWYLNGGLVLSGSNVYLAEAPGVYSVEVSGTDICPVIADGVFISQGETPSPAVQILDGSLQNCYGEVAVIAVTSTFDTYDWYYNGELLEEEHEAICIAYQSGTYYAVVTNGNCVGQTVPININFADEITPPIINPVAGICNGDLLTISTLPIYEEYQWYQNGIALSNNFTNEVSISSGGTYQLYVEDENGCEGWSEEMVIQNYDLPEVTLISDEQFCPGESTQVQATEGYLVYEWFINGELIANSSSPDFTITEESEVYVVVTNENGCQTTTNALDVSYSPIPNPGISIDGETAFCVGGEVHLTVDQNYQNIQWLNNGEAIDGANSLDYIATVSGLYTVQVDNGECIGETEGVEVTVFDLPQAFVSSSQEAPFCIGETVMLFTSSEFASYQWFYNGLPVFEATTASNSVTQSGSYYVQLTDNNGCLGYSDTLEVIFNDLTDITITLDEGSNFCEGGAVTMEATSGFFTYTWLLNDENVQSGPSNNFEMSGSGTVVVIGEDPNACENISAPVEINTLPVPSPEIIVNGDPNLCQGEGISLAIAGFYPIIEWYKDGVLLPAMVTNSVVVNESGSYTVVVDNLEGCSGTSDPIIVNVEEIPMVSITEVSQSDIPCVGESLTLEASTNFANYQWYQNGFLLLQNGPESSISITENGVYTVIASTANNCTSQSNQVIVEFGIEPSINLSASYLNICPNEESLLIAVSNGDSFNWSPNDGSLSCSTCPSPIVTPNSTTTYTVTISNSNGCESSESITINVLDENLSLVLSGEEETVCVGQGHPLTASEGFENYLWVYNGITYLQNGSSNTFAASAAGSYQVIATSDNSCEFISNTFEVEFNPNPSDIEVEISSEGGLCDDEPFMVTAFSGGTSYEWTINPDGTVSANPLGATLDFDLQSESFVISITNEFGCTNTTDPINWSPNETEIPEIFAQEPAACEGQSFTISCPGNYDEIQWYLNGLVIPNATFSILEVTETGNYSVYVEDKNGCVGLSDNVLITIHQAPEPILSPENLVLCNTDDLSGFELTATPNYVNYDWYLFGLLLVQSGPNNSFIPLEAGLYTVEVTDENGCVGVSNVADVDLIEAPFLNISAANETLCPGESTELFVSAQQNASIAWSDGGDNSTLSCTDCPNPTVTIQETTIYTVSITSPGGCSNAASISIDAATEQELSLMVFSGEVSDTVLCEGEMVPLLATNGLPNYTWYLNGAVISGENQSALIVETAGDYFYSSATDNNCVAFSEVVSISFNESPSVSINVGGTACETGGVEVIAEPANYDSYQFFFNGLDQGINESNTFTTQQSGEVYVIAYDEIGCSGTSVSINVNVEGNAIPSIIPSQEGGEICEGEMITLTVQGIYDTYQWYLDGEAIDATNANLSVNQAGAYNVVVNSGLDCEGTSDPYFVTINNVDPPLIINPTNVTDDLVCSEDLPYYLVAEAGYAAYDWYLDGVLINTGTGNDSLLVEESGTYTLVGINEEGCEATSPDQLNINVLDFIDLDMDATEFFVCPGTEVTLFANTVQGDNFEWTSDIADEFSCLDCFNPTVTPEETTIYTVLVTDDNGCFVTGNVTIIVSEEIAPVISTEAVTLCELTEQAFVNVTNDDFFEYQWYLNGEAIDGEVEAALTTTVGGEFYVEALTFSACTLTSNTVSIDGQSVDVPFVSASSFELCDVGQNVTLDAGLQVNGNAYTNYTWFVGSGGVPVGFGQTYTVENEGEYFVVVENSLGCSANSSSIVITSGPNPPAIGSNFANICDGSNPTVFVETDAEFIYWFEVNNPLDTLNDLSTDSILVEETGIYYAIVGNDETCFTLSDTIGVQVFNNIVEQIGFELQDIACIGETNNIAYIGSVLNQEVLTWDFDGADFVFSAVDNNHQLTWNEEGTYEVTVSYGVGDCIFDFTQSVEVFGANLDISIETECIDTCVNTLGSFLLSFDQDTTDMAVLWSGPDGFSANTFSISNLDAGTYNAFIQDVNGCSFEETIEMCYVDATGGDLQANPDTFALTVNQIETVCPLLNDTGNDPFILDVTDVPDELTVNIVGDCLEIIPGEDVVGEFVISYIIQDDCNNFEFTDIVIVLGPPGETNSPPILLTAEVDLACAELTLPTEICLEVEDPDGNTIIISEIESVLGSSIDLTDDLCFLYLFNETLLPKGADTLAIDTMNIQLCDEQPIPLCVDVEVLVYILDCEPPTVDSLSLDICVGDTLPQTICHQFVDPDGLDVNIPFIYSNSGTAVEVVNDSCILYTPTDLLMPMDTVFIEVCNSANSCSTSILVVNYEVCEPNLPPLIDTMFVEVCSGDLEPTIICPEIIDPNGDVAMITDIDSHFNCGTDQIDDSCFEYVTLPALEDLVDTVKVTICDDQGACSTSIVLVDIYDCADVCEEFLSANDDGFSIITNESITFDPLENDMGIDIAMSGFTSLPLNGSFNMNAGGTYTYQPFTDFLGTDSLHYIISDSCANLDTATVVIFVINENNVGDNVPPSEATIGLEVCQNDETVQQVCYEFSDPNGDEVFISELSNTNGATVEVLSDSCFTYVVPADFVGEDEVEITVCDGALCSTSTLMVFIFDCGTEPEPCPIPLEAQEDEYEVATNDTIVFNVLDNDLGTDLTVEGIADLPDNGTLEFNASGEFVYSSNVFYFGDDFIEYIVSDSCANLDTAIVSIKVLEEGIIPHPPNNPPNIDTLSITACQDVFLPQEVCFNFTDPDGDNVQVNDINSLFGCSIEILNDTCFSYILIPGLTGQDIVEIEVCDPDSLCATSILVVDIIDCSEVPCAVNLAAQEDEYEMLSNDTIIINVLENDLGTDLTIEGITSSPNNGSIGAAGLGGIIYIPTADYVGLDSIEYFVSDSCANLDTALVVINVLEEVIEPENNPPNIDTLSITVCDDVFLPEEACFSFTDPDGDAVHVNDISSLYGCSIEILNDTCFSYILIPGLTGQDIVEIEVCDSDSLCSTSILIVDIIDCTEEPEPCMSDLSAQDDEYIINQNEPSNLIVLENDSGMVIGFPLITTLTSNGTVGPNFDGSITYVPVTDFVGQDNFHYAISDSCGNIDTALVSITVIEITEPEPICESNLDAVDDEFIVFANQINYIDISANDTGTDSLILGIPDSLEHGIFGINMDSIYHYIPDEDYVGTDFFSYLAFDTCGNVDTAYVNLTIIEDTTNNPPNIDTLTIDVCENVIQTEVICHDFSDPDGDAVTIEDLSSIFECSLEILGEDCFSYILIPGLTGQDIVEITVCDENGLCSNSILLVNIIPCVPNPCDPSIIAQDDAFDVLTDQANALDILGNDTGIDLTFVGVITTPTNGSIGLNPDGTINYVPIGADFVDDSFEYSAMDSCGNLDTALVEITLVDLPNPCDNISELCVEPVTPTVVCVDFCNVDANSFISISTEFNCSVGSIDFPCITYTSLPGEFSEDTLTIVATDAAGVFDTAYVNITVGNCGGIDAVEDSYTIPYGTSELFLVMDNDLGESIGIVNITQPEHGSVFTSGQGLLYQPLPDYSGPDEFTYEICNPDGNCDEATVSILVEGPCVNYEELCAAPGSPLTICPEYCGWTEGYEITSVLSNTNIAANFIITDFECIEFTALGGQEYVDTLIITACEAGGVNCQEATIVVDIFCAAPQPVEDYYEVIAGTGPIAFNVLSNDNILCNGELSLNDFSPPSNGTLESLGNGDLVYTPNEDYIGPDAFIYEVCNGCNTDCEQGVVLIEVVSDPGLLLVDDNFTGEEDQEIILDVLANDIVDEEADFESWSHPQNGTVVYFNKDFIYIPNDGFTGEDYFIYNVCDNGLCDDAVVRIDVSGNFENINDMTPIAQTDSVNVEPNQSIEIPVLNNDSNPTNGALSIESVTEPNSGYVSIQADQITYMPEDGFNGETSFTYTVCNELGLCATSQVIINVSTCQLFIPNAFSPNSDGVNDELFIQGMACYENNGLFIYNRAGEEVYAIAPYTTDNLWNGTKATGKELPAGVYFYIFIPNQDQPKEVQKGFITIKR